MIYLNRASKSTKKFNIFTVLLAIAAFMTAIFCCACKTGDTSDCYEPNTVFPPEFVGYLKDKKVYVTSAGQSVEIINLVLNMDTVDGLEYEENSLLEAHEVEQGAVVFIVVGCSIKSLAESGLSKESELKRSQEFVTASKQGKFDIICWHIGGVARRGATSDTLIEYLFANCSLALFRADGNSDLKLSDWADSGGVPYLQFESNIASVLRLLTGENDVH